MVSTLGERHNVPALDLDHVFNTVPDKIKEFQPLL